MNRGPAPVVVDEFDRGNDNGVVDGRSRQKSECRGVKQERLNPASEFFTVLQPRIIAPCGYDTANKVAVLENVADATEKGFDFFEHRLSLL